ncbi:MAG TPA: bifunctional proline dehydrogenase/L-glutamate gamma-semialdehyde dehydrogenase PutA, partial [Alphaproteobacteria bacterium]|nr:bifunctional proline dehydrogenase/L-glutamate gamma-semialdehyde dehydrogenase PutA [Alphaproteobacteria bacterium]
MIFSHPLPEASASRAAVRAAARIDEDACVAERLALARLPEETRRRIEQRAGSLVQRVREERVATGGIDAFLQEYELSSKEGVTLMCLAEALLRVPDAETADRLIRDKIGGADWEGHMGRAESWFVNASTWALMLTGRVLELNRPGREWRDVLGTLISRSGEPVIRQALTQAMRIMGRQFVMARNIESALERAERDEARGYRHSYDMLGEAARTMADARRYMDSYAHAIEAVGRAAAGRGPIESPGISVKLSALHPRYEFAQADRAMAELLPRIQELARLAKSHDIGLTIDAEEADRLDLSLDVIAAVAEDPALSGWNGFGLAVQAYQKRALPLIDWLAELATAASRRLMVRLVKGAYWDTEIKLSQVEGLADYPVFTRKANTDVSYLACMQRMLEHRAQIYPAFATHNAHTVAAALELAGNRRDFEFQRLHGMGEPLYDGIAGQAGEGVPCRVYAPVGGHGDLLAYLVRRLLENGANTSFVHRIADEDLPVARVVADPVAAVERLQPRRNPHIPLPRALYGERRLNARGVDLADPVALAELAEQMEAALLSRHYAGPLIGGRQRNGTASERYDPADRRRIAGLVADATPEQAGEALAIAAGAFPAWEMTPAAERAAMLRRAAELYEQHMPELMGLAVREAGKTVRDAVAEVREAVDFLRYYAMRAEDEFAGPLPLPGPTGEENRMMLRGRGAFLCISPWNFPLAIFTGQLS